MKCINNKSDFGHGTFASLTEGESYVIEGEEIRELEHGESKHKTQYPMIKIKGLRYEKRRFE